MPTNAQMLRPTIIFTNGYPDADATVQDVVERVERLQHRPTTVSDAQWAAGGMALLEAQAELRDLGVAQ